MTISTLVTKHGDLGAWMRYSTADYRKWVGLKFKAELEKRGLHEACRQLWPLEAAVVDLMEPVETPAGVTEVEGVVDTTTYKRRLTLARGREKDWSKGDMNLMLRGEELCENLHALKTVGNVGDMTSQFLWLIPSLTFYFIDSRHQWTCSCDIPTSHCP